MDVPPPPIFVVKSAPKLNKHKNRSAEMIKKPSSELKIGVDEIRTKLKCLPAWRCEQISEDLSSWASVYNPVTAIIQDGPQCGIVALCMASQLLCPQPLTPDIVFETAKSQGFTTYGEMFSVKDMCKLAKTLLECEATRVTSSLSHSETFFKHLDDGWPILVPYDKDESNGPCCRNGNKAHWAVITGYLVQNITPSTVSKLDQDLFISNLYHKQNDINLASKLTCQIHYNQPTVYVYGKQGKSKHLGIWSYQELLQSNGNLMEWHAGNNNVEERKMVFPEGGIKQGLCNQILLLKPKN